MANGTPTRTLAEALRGNIDLETATLRVALFNDTTAFTFDPDAHEFLGDVLDGGTTAEEFGGSGGTGYTRQDLVNVDITELTGGGGANVDADDITFADIDGETIQGAIIYEQVGGDDTTPGDDPIIQVYDNDQADVDEFPIATNGSNVALAWASEGILTVKAV